MILLTVPPTLEGVESLIWSWTFVGVLSLLVLFGTLLSWSCIASLLLLLELQLTRMGALELLCILLFGPVAVQLRGVGFVSLHGTLLGFLVLLVFGGMVPLVGLISRFAMLMLVSGRILLDSW